MIVIKIILYVMLIYSVIRIVKLTKEVTDPSLLIKLNQMQHEIEMNRIEREIKNES